MLLDAKAMWVEESYLLIINTHLDPTNEGHSQEIQLREVVQFIGEALREVQSVVGSLNKVALLLCGDFNIDGKSKRHYELITNSLGNGVHDIGLEWASSEKQSAKMTFSGNSYDLYTLQLIH
jgi:endonuclease/exonuclease/phosphatase family metal-dependent hydrolase